jgi:hypothetical protein
MDFLFCLAAIRMKHRYIIAHGFPDKLDTYFAVLMGSNIAHGLYIFPWHLVIPAFEWFGKVGSKFAYLQDTHNYGMPVMLVGLKNIKRIAKDAPRILNILAIF